MEAALSVFEQVIEALQGIDLISRADWSNLVDGLILTGSIYAHELFDAYTHEGAIDDGIGHRVLKDTVLRDLLHFVNQMGAAKDFSQIDEAKQKAIEAATTAEAAAQSSRRAAGEAGSLNLAEHFDAYRKSERRAAEILRASAVVLVIVTVVILTRLPHTGLTLADVLQRALIAVPAFGLAGYLAAESGRHRRASQWAATLKVQLLTVDAYVQPLGPEAAAEIRQLLAKRAFEDLPAAAGGAKDKEEQPLQIGTQAIVEKFIDGLKPNPDK